MGGSGRDLRLPSCWSPSSALAGNDDPALLKFQRPERGSSTTDFEALGLDMDHEVDKNADGASPSRRGSTDRAARLVAPSGYENVGVVHDKYNVDHIRARARRGHRGRGRREAGARRQRRRQGGPSAAPGTVRAQRGDFYENNVGRFISIEANTTQASVTCTNPNTGSGCSTPARCCRRPRTTRNNKLIGQGALTTYIDPDPSASPDYYQYHYQIFRIGNKGDGGTGSGLREGLRAQRRRRRARREGVAAERRRPLRGEFQHDFNTHYWTRRRATPASTTLAAAVPEHLARSRPAEQTWGYQRRRDHVGYQQRPSDFAPSTDRPDHQAPNGHPDAERGQRAERSSCTRRPGASTAATTSPRSSSTRGQQRAAHRLASPTRSITVSLATDATGAITSTAAQVIAAINANADAATLVEATKYRTSAADGVVMARATLVAAQRPG